MRRWGRSRDSAAWVSRVERRRCFRASTLDAALGLGRQNAGSWRCDFPGLAAQPLGSEGRPRVCGWASLSAAANVDSFLQDLTSAETSSRAGGGGEDAASTHRVSLARKITGGRKGYGDLTGIGGGGSQTHHGCVALPVLLDLALRNSAPDRVSPRCATSLL